MYSSFLFWGCAEEEVCQVETKGHEVRKENTVTTAATRARTWLMQYRINGIIRRRASAHREQFNLTSAMKTLKGVFLFIWDKTKRQFQPEKERQDPRIQSRQMRWRLIDHSLRSHLGITGEEKVCRLSTQKVWRWKLMSDVHL